MAKYREFVITDIAQVPAGFVPLANWAAHKRHHNNLCAAKSSGKIRSCKLMRHSSDRTGPVWVHPDDAKAALEMSGLSATVTKTLPFCRDESDDTDSRQLAIISIIEQKLERIANSLDLIADAATRVATTNEAKDAAQSYE
jgi:hypothetical protein